MISEPTVTDGHNFQRQSPLSCLFDPTFIAGDIHQRFPKEVSTTVGVEQNEVGFLQRACDRLRAPRNQDCRHTPECDLAVFVWSEAWRGLEDEIPEVCKETTKDCTGDLGSEGHYTASGRQEDSVQEHEDHMAEAVPHS